MLTMSLVLLNYSIGWTILMIYGGYVDEQNTPPKYSLFYGIMLLLLGVIGLCINIFFFVLFWLYDIFKVYLGDFTLRYIKFFDNIGKLIARKFKTKEN